jgi:hypothetical protein
MWLSLDVAQRLPYHTNARGSFKDFASRLQCEMHGLFFSFFPVHHGALRFRDSNPLLQGKTRHGTERLQRALNCCVSSTLLY